MSTRVAARRTFGSGWRSGSPTSSGATNLSGATLMPWYARALGATVERYVDLHSVPPITGMLAVGKGAAIEPEVDLTGHWLDGDIFYLGTIAVGPQARVGARSTLAPGAAIGKAAEIAPGSAVFGTVPDGEAWSGAPARRVGLRSRSVVGSTRLPRAVDGCVHLDSRRRRLPPDHLVRRRARRALPPSSATHHRSMTLPASAFLWLPLGVVLGLVVLALLVVAAVRIVGIALDTGPAPVHSRQAWQAWTTLRVLDEARTWLFPLYASTLTPPWFRLLGAKIGRDVEISTALLIPNLTTVNDGAFLADDTLIGSYELGGGWLRIDRAKVGKRAFVGNSGMTAPGRKVPKQGLVAVLSAAPRRSKAKAGTSWLGSPPVQAAAHLGRGRQQPDL